MSEKPPVFQPINPLWALLAFPFGGMFALALKIWSFLVRIEPADLSPVPENALMYGTHYDVYCASLHPGLRKPPMIVVGYEGFLPYLYVPWDHWVGISHLCYFKSATVSPLDQLLKVFTKYSNYPFFIFTDSGGPYGRVRSSLVGLSVNSQRPVVAVRFLANRSFPILGHRIPLPFSRLRMVTSSAVNAQTLYDLGVEGARAKLQETLDALSVVASGSEAISQEKLQQ